MSEKLTEGKTFTPEELKEILHKHQLWLDGEEGGERANLESANLESANLVRANLYSANLESANLYSANLYSANLESANLVRANLYSANLVRANLESANLVRANLYSANLVRANLESANLESANLESANLESANLESAKYGDDILRGFLQIGPIGSRKSMLQVFGVGAAGFIFRAGCFTGNLEEFAAIVERKHGDNEHGIKYTYAIEFARQMLPAIATEETAEAVNE